MRLRLGTLAGPLACGLLAAAGSLGVATTPVRLEPGTPVWERAVLGVPADGVLVGSAALRIPGIDRRRAARLVVQAERVGGGPSSLGVSVDDRPFAWSQVGVEALWFVVPAEGSGLKVRLSVQSGRSVRLRAIEIRSADPSALARIPWWGAFLVLVAVFGTTSVLARSSWSPHATALGLVMAGACGLVSIPLFLLWTVPLPGSLLRLAFPLLLLLTGCGLGARSTDRGRLSLGAVLVISAVFGAWVRAYVLPSAGSWDTDYWKLCARRVVAEGITRAYGDPEPLPFNRLLAQAVGRDPLWEVQGFGRSFSVDQPPGIMALWGVCRRFVTTFTDLVGDVAENTAVKLPPVLGDLLSVGLLLLAYPGTRGYVLGALYWALPISWLSSALLGYFDGTHVPFTVAALLAAGRGWAGLAGLSLAVALLVKSTALLVAPAVIVALIAARASLRRATLVGALALALAFLPFLLEGTLATTLVHLFRIFFQERLSGGFANPWWLAGHFVSLAQGVRSGFDPVPFVHVRALPWSPNPFGLVGFLGVAGWLALLHRRCPGPRPAALAGATLVVTYALLAVGVHENHPHALVLAFMATGLASRRLRVLAGVFMTTYVLNMLALSGLGRFYGPHHLALEGASSAVAGLRMLPGFDVTLVLALVNIVAYGALLWTLRREMQAVSEPARPLPSHVAATDTGMGKPD